MGFLDLPAPLLTWLDGFLAPIAPVWRISLWAVLGSIATMALYWLCSAQEEIARIKSDAISARRELANYDGTDFNVIWPMSRDVLAHSGRHFLVVFWPAIIASLPMLFLIVWISNSYGYRLPQASVELHAQVLPESAEVRWSPAAIAKGDGSFDISWPPADGRLELLDQAGNQAVLLPLPAAVPVIHKKQWWNYIIANPAGYLADDVEIDELRLRFPKYHVLEFGPQWARSWETPFFVVLVICSLAIKVVFRID